MIFLVLDRQDNTFTLNNELLLLFLNETGRVGQKPFFLRTRQSPKVFPGIDL